jgi:hypothetical protein
MKPAGELNEILPELPDMNRLVHWYSKYNTNRFRMLGRIVPDMIVLFFQRDDSNFKRHPKIRIQMGCSKWLHRYRPVSQSEGKRGGTPGEKMDRWLWLHPVLL